MGSMTIGLLCSINYCGYQYGVPLNHTHVNYTSVPWVEFSSHWFITPHNYAITTDTLRLFLANIVILPSACVKCRVHNAHAPG